MVDFEEEEWEMSLLENKDDVQKLVDSLNFKQKIDRSLTLIEEAYKKYGDSMVVANSLGKDSVTVWNLEKRVSPDIRGFIVTTRFKPQETIDFMKEEIDIEKYKIVLADLDGDLGEAMLDTIFISPKAFEQGKKEVVATLIEEYSHLDSKAGDKTRNFQNYLIKKYIEVIEVKKVIYL